MCVCEKTVCARVHVCVRYICESSKSAKERSTWEQGAVYWGRSGTDSIYYNVQTSLWKSYTRHPRFSVKILRAIPHSPSPPPPLFLLPLPPAAPSHSSYEPRAGRSEYNFLYCVNVRTYVWIRKMFILQKNVAVDSFASRRLHTTRQT